jgi:hypothetical protein
MTATAAQRPVSALNSDNMASLLVFVTEVNSIIREAMQKGMFYEWHITDAGENSGEFFEITMTVGDPLKKRKIVPKGE